MFYFLIVFFSLHTLMMNKPQIKLIIQPVDPEVVPLPNEIMKSLPVLTLAAQEKQSELPSKKKDRRQIRHQRWLQSTICDDVF